MYCGLVRIFTWDPLAHSAFSDVWNICMLKKKLTHFFCSVLFHCCSLRQFLLMPSHHYMFLCITVRVPLIPIHHMEAHALTARLIKRWECVSACLCVCLCVCIAGFGERLLCAWYRAVGKGERGCTHPLVQQFKSHVRGSVNMMVYNLTVVFFKFCSYVT